MANKSNWKNFEWAVARALGGKRRLRTMESFGKEAPDVYFSKKMRKQFPLVKQVAVECKKRKSQPIPSFFVEAKLKYGKDGKRIILASKVPLTKRARKSWEKRKLKLGKRLGLKTKKELKQLQLRDFAASLVTVELSFFKELWEAWLKGGNRDSEKRFPRLGKAWACPPKPVPRATKIPY